MNRRDGNEGSAIMQDIKVETPAAPEPDRVKLREAGKRKQKRWEDDVEDRDQKKVKQKAIQEDVSCVRSTPSSSVPARGKVQQSESSSGDEEGQYPSPKSKYAGVHWNRRKRKWRVRIKANGRDKHVGYFKDEESAAWAYDRAVVMHNPSWSTDKMLRLNFPKEAAEGITAAAVDREKAEKQQQGMDGVGAICMILAASMSPNTCATSPAAEFETPPPCVSDGTETRTMSSEGSTASRVLGFRPSSALQFNTPTPASSSRPASLRDVGSNDDDDKASNTNGSSSEGETRSTPCESMGKESCRASPSLMLSNRTTPADPARGAQGGAFIAPLPPSFTAAAHEGRNLQPVLQRSSSPLFQLPADKPVNRELIANSSLSQTTVFSWSPFEGMFRANRDSHCSNAYSHASSSPSPSLCHEGELEAVKGLVELAGVFAAEQEEASRLEEQSSSTPSKGVTQRGEVRKRGENAGASSRRKVTDAARPAAPKAWRGVKGVGPGEEVGSGGMENVKSDGEERGPQMNGNKRSQSFRGVTWDKMKKMWRVRVCLAGGGREHVGYFLNEKEGALAYTRALGRIKQLQAEKLGMRMDCTEPVQCDDAVPMHTESTYEDSRTEGAERNEDKCMSLEKSVGDVSS